MGRKLNTVTIGDLRKNPSLNTDIGLGKDFLVSIKKSAQALNEAMSKFNDALNKSLEKIKNDNPAFIQNDWYLSNEYWFDFNLSELYTNNSIDLENKILKLFEDNKKAIEKRLIEENDERVEIIKELFTLYKNKHYFSLINLAYSLVEGISIKKFNTKFWGWEKKNQNNKLRTEKIKLIVEDDTVFNFIEKRLEYRGIMNASFDAISKEDLSKTNNRHCVAHGESYLYGNKTNAVKSILLVEFISSLKINPNY